MLGRRHRPQLIGSLSEIDGLGFLDISTEMTADKQLAQVGATHLGSGIQISGYEIHIGRTTGADTARPVMRILSGGAERDDGAISPVAEYGDAICMACLVMTVSGIIFWPDWEISLLITPGL